MLAFRELHWPWKDLLRSSTKQAVLDLAQEAMTRSLDPASVRPSSSVLGEPFLYGRLWLPWTKLDQTASGPE